MTTETRSKPSYLGLLNGISLGESRAGVYLKGWADVTSDAELKRVLTLVAARETSHGQVFCQLVERLGFSLRENDDPKFAEQVKVYCDPNLSDIEKIRFGRRGQNGDGSVNPFFASIDEKVNDESIDQLTRDTLRWYVHEERDSGTLLREQYTRIEAGAGMTIGSVRTNGAAPAALAPEVVAMMQKMTDGFTALQECIGELTQALARREKSRDK